VNMQAWRHSLFSFPTWEQIGASMSELRAVQYDVAVDFQGAIRSALLARCSGAPVVYGFAQPRENAASLFYTRQVQARGTHIVEQNLSLASALASQELAFPGVEFPHDETVEQELRRKLANRGIGENVILNPGAGWGAKQWPVERYGDVARRLAQETGLRSLINFGPGEETLARVLEKASAGAAEVISTSVTELIGLTRHAKLFIGGDTGPMHLAAALGIPVAAIFGPTNPARNGPFATNSIVLRNPASPTTHKRRKQPDEGMLEISVGDALAAAIRLMKDARA